ncbi:hypothetical protein A0H81_13073 [Grifola frondosa]|uniref:Uncharacterized protein n=1 Tax=Grifola frondosa TaxID=5627 RepID=A0A1C7LRG3_GRIFR|nr:hypothetical protein A0H81_13073 [Grifola frondosa]
MRRLREDDRLHRIAFCAGVPAKNNVSVAAIGTEWSHMYVCSVHRARGSCVRQVIQVKSVRPVARVEAVRGIVWDEEAKRWEKSYVDWSV